MSDSPNTLRDQFTATILQVFRTNGQVLTWGDRFAAAFDLTSARWQMLGALALAPRPLTSPQLAVTMGVTRQGAQKQLDLLLADGLVEKQANPYHKRSPLYQLTAAGQAQYLRIANAWNRHAEQVSQEFSAKDLATTLKVLSRINELHPLDQEGNAP